MKHKIMKKNKISGFNSNWDEKLNVRKPKCLQNTNYDKTQVGVEHKILTKQKL